MQSYRTPKLCLLLQLWSQFRSRAESLWWFTNWLKTDVSFDMFVDVSWWRTGKIVPDRKEPRVCAREDFIVQFACGTCHGWPSHPSPKWREWNNRRMYTVAQSCVPPASTPNQYKESVGLRCQVWNKWIMVKHKFLAAAVLESVQKIAGLTRPIGQSRKLKRQFLVYQPEGRDTDACLHWRPQHFPLYLLLFMGSSTQKLKDWSECPIKAQQQYEPVLGNDAGCLVTVCKQMSQEKIWRHATHTHYIMLVWRRCQIISNNKTRKKKKSYWTCSDSYGLRT